VDCDDLAWNNLDLLVPKIK